MENLKNQRILIIGGSSGMGLACARRLASKGAHVIIASRSQASLDAALTTVPGSASAHVVDFSSESSLEALFTAVGRIDHLVLAASSSAAWGPFRDVSGAVLLKAFEQKALGYWQSIRAALPHLRKDGSVTLLSGTASRTALMHTAGLAAINGAITQMGQTLAMELAPLRVNVVSPGLIDTPAYDHLSHEAKTALFDGMIKDLHVGRAGTSEEVAQAMEFVITNDFTTGALIDIDGGSR
ncbi:SDR family oxidoreductase [Dyella terrae]|uniref:SDR family oxidoreductase n=1 Tax=Dyella terrae TaxID=522259 RepID=UPI001EFD3B42|nr:SDR family oxidoreductase [Dyella terrae]ULU23367.1 SDR family oxidoreductase [Dyella terrae]